MKKLLTYIFLITFSIAILTNKSFAESQYNDDNEFINSLNFLHSNSITKYDNINDFKPDNLLTREQASKFFVEFGENVLKKSFPTTLLLNSDFKDINDSDYSLKSYIVSASDNGLMKGNNNYFRPTDNMTRAEAFTVLVRMLTGSQDENIDPWWKNYHSKAVELGLTKDLSGDTFENNISRYEISLILYRAKDILESKETKKNQTIADSNTSTSNKESTLLDLNSSNTATQNTGRNNTAFRNDNDDFTSLGGGNLSQSSNTSDTNTQVTNYAYKNTSIYTAIRNGDLSNIKEIIESGIDINAKTEFGKTPLIYAVLIEANPEIITYLLSKNPNLDIEDSNGYTFFDRLDWYSKDKSSIINYLVQDKGDTIVVYNKEYNKNDLLYDILMFGKNYKYAHILNNKYYTKDNIIIALNKIRSKYSLKSFTFNNQLALAAENHSNYIKINGNSEAHDETEGKSGFTGKYPWDRAIYVGYSDNYIGENINFVTGNILLNLQGLLYIPYHRSSYLNNNYTDIGFCMKDDCIGVVDFGGKSLNELSSFVYPDKMTVFDYKKFIRETPKPFADDTKGFPITIYGKSVDKSSIKLIDTTNNNSQIGIVFANDNNNSYFIHFISQNLLQNGHTYQVQYSDGGVSKTATFAISDSNVIINDGIIGNINEINIYTGSVISTGNTQTNTGNQNSQINTGSSGGEFDSSSLVGKIMKFPFKASSYQWSNIMRIIPSPKSGIALLGIDADGNWQIYYNGRYSNKYKLIYDMVFSPDASSFSFYAKDGNSRMIVKDKNVIYRGTYQPKIKYSSNSQSYSYLYMKDGINYLVKDGNQITGYDNVTNFWYQNESDLYFTAIKDGKMYLIKNDVVVGNGQDTENKKIPLFSNDGSNFFYYSLSGNKEVYQTDSEKLEFDSIYADVSNNGNFVIEGVNYFETGNIYYVKANGGEAKYLGGMSSDIKRDIKGNNYAFVSSNDLGKLFINGKDVGISNGTSFDGGEISNMINFNFDDSGNYILISFLSSNGQYYIYMRELN